MFEKSQLNLPTANTQRIKKENQIPPALFLITAPTAVQYFLLISPDNPALRQIIRRQFNRNFISGKNTNKVHT